MTLKRLLLALTAGVLLSLSFVVAPATAANYPPPGGEASTSAPAFDPPKVEGTKLSSDPGDQSGSGLAKTGGDVIGLGVAALALIGLGAGLVVVVRRRREHGTPA